MSKNFRVAAIGLADPPDDETRKAICEAIERALLGMEGDGFLLRGIVFQWDDEPRVVERKGNDDSAA